jgi:hypothetical protein
LAIEPLENRHMPTAMPILSDIALVTNDPSSEVDTPPAPVDLNIVIYAPSNDPSSTMDSGSDGSVDPTILALPSDGGDNIIPVDASGDIVTGDDTSTGIDGSSDNGTDGTSDGASDATNDNSDGPSIDDPGSDLSGDTNDGDVGSDDPGVISPPVIFFDPPLSAPGTDSPLPVDFFFNLGGPTRFAFGGDPLGQNSAESAGVPLAMSNELRTFSTTPPSSIMDSSLATTIAGSGPPLAACVVLANPASSSLTSVIDESDIASSLVSDNETPNLVFTQNLDDEVAPTTSNNGQATTAVDVAITEWSTLNADRPLSISLSLDSDWAATGIARPAVRFDL